MDISALSEKDFNAVEWINSNYKKFVEENGGTGTGGDDIELKNAFINSYVSKLQLYVQQVNFAVEETSQQVVANMPRIIKDVKTLHTDVQQLQQRMAKMRKEVAAVQEETGECMATLERLNKKQTELQAAKESLQESDGWGNLITELEDSFERNELQTVCEKLMALQKSLVAQEKLDGHAERQAQVEDFKNRLEALASPSVVQVFAEGNIEQAQKYATIFAGINRLPQLKQYYRAVQKNSLQQHWKETLELVGGDGSQQFLTLLYDQLLEVCQKQFKWCVNVFGAGVDAGEEQPFLVIAELLPALEPTRDQHILKMLRSSNERLDVLQRIAQSQQTFVIHLNAYIKQSGVALPEETMKRLSESIYEYFYKFIQQYPRLEETHLSTQVDRFAANQASTAEAVRHLDDSTRKLFTWLVEACERCSLITCDLALCKLIALMGGIFKRLLDNYAKAQRQLNLSITNVGGADWSLLQHCLSLLQGLSDFQQRLNKFEQTLHERMTALAEQLKNSNAVNLQVCIFTVFDRNEIQRTLTTIKGYQAQRADASNLSQSSLGIFTPVYGTLRTHFGETHEVALNILLQPIEAHLANIQPPLAMDDAGAIDVSLPDFSFAPQECITQIGQYLLTLPQHLEPLLLSPSALLRQALEVANIQYTQTIPCADVLLSLVVEQCCVLYQSRILHIKNLSAGAAKQLAIDIEYLSNVVDELGLSINQHLSQILILLKASPENYLSLSSGCEPRLVTAIRQMRNIMSTQ